ncbi:MAG: Flp pilus assembly complex ATPase component TadA, partial [Acidobacteria bacterium]|nr:Flp pilus assembly complex ATPase component TadA [Acidobacteriota bacterium]
MRKKRLGDVLKGQGKISEQDLELVIAAQQGKVLRLGELLLERELVSKADIAAALAEVSGMRYVECPPATIVLDVLAVIPPDLALRCHALPVEREGKNLIVAMAEPQNLEFLDELRFASGLEISPRFSFRDGVLAGIKKFYGVEESSQATEEEETGDQKPQRINETDTSGIEFLSTSSREKSREALQELQAGMKQRTPAVHLVSKILAAAASKKASDIHFEPNSSGLTVRLRVDGVLCEWGTVPAALQASVISRVKILADLDIAERRVPQDGRFLIQYRGGKFDLRVSTMLTSFGEKAVLRLLDPTATRVSFQQLGISRENADELAEILAQPQGMLLVTGPTGSGKSTTLYAALNLLHVPSRNIVTVEDPVEHMLEGVNQIQVNRKAGLNFANCLRSVLRQDPDIIMVGEIRDGETAEIAMEAAETGHLVLSTLHTNDSIAAITRLLDLNVPPY